jgi:hypothetical protein
MTLDDLLLRKAAKWRPQGRQDLTVSEAGRTATLAADHVDETGARLWELTLTGPAPADLKARGLAVAARVTGLLEPLSLYEADADTVLLRSETPARRDNRKIWYEVRLGADGGVNLRRYEAEGTAPRVQKAFPLTHEAIAKFVADVVAS